MKATRAKPGFNRWKATYVLLGLAMIAALGCYGWRLWALYQAWQHDTPRPQVARLVRDLRRYHSATKRFPATFAEINERLWRTQPAPDYGRDGQQARVKNYLYRYTRSEADKCVLWALPLGPQRRLAAAYFIVITPAWLHGWRGPALTDEAIAFLNDLWICISSPTVREGGWRCSRPPSRSGY